MEPRIETAEVLSFRLKVPPAELRKLRDAVGPELDLKLESDDGELILSVEHGDSYLRFRPIGPEAMLTEIFLCRDARGLFFQRVLGELMVRFRGDLQLRLVWNTPERNAHGDFAEVRINRGVTTYPGLANALSALPPAGVGSEGIAVERDETVELSPLQREVRELLDRARAEWEEYQRLKREREGQ